MVYRNAFTLNFLDSIAAGLTARPHQARRLLVIIVIIVYLVVPLEVSISVPRSLPAGFSEDVRDVVHRAHRADSGVLTVGREGTSESGKVACGLGDQKRRETVHLTPLYVCVWMGLSTTCRYTKGSTSIM